MAGKKNKSKKVDKNYLIIGIIICLIAYLIKKFSVFRLILILLGSLLISISIFKPNKKSQKNIKLFPICFIVIIILCMLIDSIVVVTFSKVPIFTYNITNSNNARVYNAIGYRVWQCDKTSYDNLKVDPFYNKGYSCDANDIEEIDSNSFLNSVIENYNDYKNNYVKIKGKISKKNAQNYIEMQPYENNVITLNGYVTFADNITLRIIFNNTETKLDQYDVYDEIVVIGIVKNMEKEQDKYVVYMYDSKIVSKTQYDKFEISPTKEVECTEQSILYSNETNDIYSYCLESIVVSYDENKYELTSALSSNKIKINDLFNEPLLTEQDEFENKLYKFDDYAVIECNPKTSKDIILGTENMTFENVVCSNNMTENIEE